jgi:alpha-tubulin suppressor-like RCC1 family protein
MDISNIVTQLEKYSASATTTLELLILSKAIEKLKVGAVNVVTSSSSLPSLPLDRNGYIYMLDSTGDIYYNVNSEWYVFPFETFNKAYGWGQNCDPTGIVGNGLANSTSYPNPQPNICTQSDWSMLSAGQYHNLGIIDGCIYGWGSNNAGAFGNGFTFSSALPVTPLGGITNWCYTAAGGCRQSFGITTAGCAYAWGYNLSGSLGLGDTSNRCSPVQMTGGISNWCQIDVGSAHAAGVTSSGNLYTWGCNNCGQLGNLSLTSTSSPVSVCGGITNWKSVSTNNLHTLAVTSTGSLYAWGHGAYGKLGDNSAATKSSPVSVCGGITTWCQASAGFNHSLAITSGGIAYGWGRSLYGALGDCCSSDRSSPVTVVGGFTNWCSISAGFQNGVGVLTSGCGYEWGRSVIPGGASSPLLVGCNLSWSQIYRPKRTPGHVLGLATTIKKL